jgi:hypothetical protein
MAARHTDGIALILISQLHVCLYEATRDRPGYTGDLLQDGGI